MNISKTDIPGVFSIIPDIYEDDRGYLIKSFHGNTFKSLGLIENLTQTLCSVNKKHVIRGMHFQMPTKEQVKVVYVARGSILDVILDIRKGSPTYGKHVIIPLSDKNNAQAYIPAGCAHGFISLEDNTRIVYLQDKVQSPEHERGIHIDSFGMDWGTKQPIVSKKDQNLPNLKDFDSPFVYKETIYENIN